MKVHLLIGHYKTLYAGQYAPNVFLACDEYILEDNPTWWPENVAKEKAKCGDEIQAWAEIVVEVDDEKMLDALYPSRHVIPAPVVSIHPEPYVGGWVRDVNADDEEIESGDAFGYVDSVQPGGYGVIWTLGSTPKFAAADEVTYVAESEVPLSRTRA